MNTRKLPQFANHRSRKFFGPGDDEVFCRRGRSRKYASRWVVSGRGFPGGIVHVLEPANGRGWIVKMPDSTDTEARQAPLAEAVSLRQALEQYLSPVWKRRFEEYTSVVREYFRQEWVLKHEEGRVAPITDRAEAVMARTGTRR